MLRKLKKFVYKYLTPTSIRQHHFASYDDYVKAQLETHERKHERVWVQDSELELLAGVIKQEVKQPKFGLCHGVRNGAEVRTLRELLNCEVIGTEISPQAASFEHVIQWDFHKVKPEWIGKCDFVYSNSLDHSFDPEMCLKGWMSCLSPRGRCLIHWSKNHDHVDFGKNGSDCFQGSRKAYTALMEKLGVIDNVIETGIEGQRCIFVCHAKAQTMSKAA